MRTTERSKDVESLHGIAILKCEDRRSVKVSVEYRYCRSKDWRGGVVWQGQKLLTSVRRTSEAWCVDLS
jgi:hypothetical protein